MTTTIMFHDAESKLKWANQNIIKLTRGVEDFRQSGCYETRTEDDLQTGKRFHIFEVTKQVPDDLQMLSSDIIANLRSALDSAVKELVAHFGGLPAGQQLFPLGPTWKKMVTAVKSGVVEGLPVQVASVIQGILQRNIVDPDARGDVSFTICNVFDAVDQHDMLLPVVPLAGLTVKVRTKTGTERTISFSMGEGEQKGTIELLPDEQVENNGQFVLYIAFERVEGFKRQAVLTTLSHLSQTVKEVIRIFTKACEVFR